MNHRDLINKYLDYLLIANSQATHKICSEYAQRIYNFMSASKIENFDDESLNKLVIWFKQKTKCCNKLINYHIQFLRRVFKHSNIEFPYLFKFQMLKQINTTFGYFSLEEQKAIFNYLELNKDKKNTRYFRYMLYVLYDTGMRQNELIHLKTKNVNLHDQSIYLEKTKSGQPRKVYYQEHLQAILKEYIEKYKPDEYLFYNVYQNRLYERFDFKNFYKRLRRNTGLERCHSHMFRHTLGTELNDAGCSLFVIQAQLGHQDITSTKRYVHMSSMIQKKAILKTVRNKKE